MQYPSMESGVVPTEAEVASSFLVVRYRYFFIFALLLTLVALMMPGSIIEAMRVWVLGWWPWRGSGMNSGAVSADKLIHAGLFGLCGWALVRGWMSSARRWLLFYVPLLALGVLTEILQHFVPGRGADPMDLVADGVGITVGMAFAVWQIRKFGPEASFHRVR